jgi:integrase
VSHDATPPTVTRRRNGKGEVTSWQVCFSYSAEGKRVRVRERLPGVGPQDSDAAIQAAAVAFWRSRLAQAEQAQAAWTLAEAGYDLPRVGELARRPLREIAALWVASLEARRVRPGTITARQKSLARAPEWLLDLAASDLTPHDLEQAEAQLAADGYANNSIIGTTGALKACLGWLRRKRRAITRDPFEGATCRRRAGRQVVQEEIEYYTEGERDRLLEHMSRPWRMIAQLGCFTGLRVGELLALHVGDVDLEAQTIRVERTRLGIAETGPTKTGTTRTVPLCATARQAVREALLARGASPHPALFPCEEGGYRSPSGYRKSWRRACKAAGVPVYSPGSTRHTFATTLISRGVGLYEVSKLLGHASITTTEIYYAALRQDTLALAVASLDRGGEEQVGNERRRGADEARQ